MNAQRINIPSAPAAIDAARIVMLAIREGGMDPHKGIENDLVVECAKSWTRGELTREEFVRAMRNIVILNPLLAKGAK